MMGHLASGAAGLTIGLSIWSAWTASDEHRAGYCQALAIAAVAWAIVAHIPL